MPSVHRPPGERGGCGSAERSRRESPKEATTSPIPTPRRQCQRRSLALFFGRSRGLHAREAPQKIQRSRRDRRPEADRSMSLSRPACMVVRGRPTRERRRKLVLGSLDRLAEFAPARFGVEFFGKPLGVNPISRISSAKSSSSPGYKIMSVSPVSVIQPIRSLYFTHRDRWYQEPWN